MTLVQTGYAKCRLFGGERSDEDPEDSFDTTNSSELTSVRLDSGGNISNLKDNTSSSDNSSLSNRVNSSPSPAAPLSLAAQFPVNLGFQNPSGAAVSGLNTSTTTPVTSKGPGGSTNPKEEVIQEKVSEATINRVKELHTQGRSLKEIKGEGFSARECLQANLGAEVVTVATLLEAGFSVENVLAAGFDKAATFSENADTRKRILQALAKELSDEAISGSQGSLGKLKEMGCFPAKELYEAKIGIAQMV